MHNEPAALQPAREKPLPNSPNGGPAPGATITTTTPLANGNGAVPENTNRTPLHEAASGGDEAKVEALLAAGADRNAKESVHGNNPLHEAAWKGYSRCVKLLCALPKTGPGGKPSAIDLLKDAARGKHGAPHDTRGALHSALLGTRNFGGFSALHLAAQNGHNQSCREILLAGADADVQNNYGDSPLHTACRYGHAGAIRILLSAKCDVERINLNGDTALHIACAMGRRKLTRILLESGCRQDAKNAQDETPRDIATRKNLVEIINILNTPAADLSPRRSRERSSSSSRRQPAAGDRPPKPDRRSRSKEEGGGQQQARKSGRRSNSNDETRGAAGANGPYEGVDPKHWSPYGCHYFPDPRNFPSPKLETLPKEPLGSGEQYFLDLAGNIRKGPVGVGNTCYCAPFFKHLEQRMNRNRRSIRRYVHRATEKLDSRMTALALRTDDQIEELTKSMIANRVQCENKRLHLEQWLKRGIAERSTTTATSGGGGGGPHSNSKTKKDEANTNTLTRCRSLELLDDHDDDDDDALLGLAVAGSLILDDPLQGASSTPASRPLFSRSIDFLDAASALEAEDDGGIHRRGHRHHHQHQHRQQQQHQHQQHQQQQLESHLRMLQYSAAAAAAAVNTGASTGHQSDAFESSNNSNMKNHSESAATPPPLPEAAVARRRARSSSVSGRDSYSYSSDNNKDHDREKRVRAGENGDEGPVGGRHRRSMGSSTNTNTPPSGVSSAGPPKSEKAKVTERLEELLSKTKKILELEKRGKGAGERVLSPACSSPPTDNRYILALDKLRDIHQYEPGGGGAGVGGLVVGPKSRGARESPAGGPAGYDIAQEMEKITKSLLPAAPVSPEIAKELSTRKERPTGVYHGVYHHQRRASTTQGSTTPLSTTPLSTMSPSSSLLGGAQGAQVLTRDESPLHLASTNFMDERDVAGGSEDQRHHDSDEYLHPPTSEGLMNGFYSNSCFDDMLPSSSNTTIKSATPRQRHETNRSDDEEEEEDEEDEEEDDDSEEEEEGVEERHEGLLAKDEEEGSDSDRCALSAMANLAELKELKSRILNGTNWRSQVLQKSVQELLKGGASPEPEGCDPSSGAPLDDDPAAETNRVRYIISRLQQSCTVNGVELAPPASPPSLRVTHQAPPPPLAQCEDFSDSSEEDEEEDGEGHCEEDEECVDGPLPVGVPGAQTVPEKAIGTAKSLIQMYEEQATAKHHPPAPAGSASGPFHVPKDAYFHELPTRKLLLPPPELSSLLLTEPVMGPPRPLAASRVHQTARSRNPLPTYLLQEGELFQSAPPHHGAGAPPGHYFDEMNHHRDPLPIGGSPFSMPSDGFLPSVGLPSYGHHPHHHQQVVDECAGPLPEKLLSARKFINPSTVSLASTGTPSPEFPLYQHHHHHQQHQQQQHPAHHHHHHQQYHSHQQAQPQFPLQQQPPLVHPAVGSSSGAVNHVIGGHSHAMMTMMAAAAAAGRKSADNLSNDDSGYVSGKVSEIHIPSGGASPLLSVAGGGVASSSSSSGNVLIIPPPGPPPNGSSPSPKHFLPYGHNHQHHGHNPLLMGLHRNGPSGSSHGSVVTAIIPPPPGGLLHPTAGQTSAQLHAAVEQKQQSLYKLGASSLV